MRRARLLPALWLAAAAAPLASSAEWRLWPDYAGGVRLDQSQGEGDDRMAVLDRPHGGVGQTFRPSAGRLHRIDLQLKNRADPRPGRLRLWRWQGSRETTRAGEPRYEGWLGMAGGRNWQTRSVHPALEVEPGALYYLEVETAGRPRFDLRAHRAGPDAYPDGRLLARQGPPGRHADLWFRTWSAEPGAGPDPPAAPPPAPPIRWSPPPAATVSVDRSDYLRRITEHARHLRRPSRTDCGRLDHRHAAFDAFLYARSCAEGDCDERLARSAIRRLEGAAGWLRCDLPTDAPPRCRERCRPERDVRSYSLLTAAPAYRWLRDSPSWTAAARRRARDLLVGTAAAYWPDRELGTSNRALRAAAGYLEVAGFFPDDPRAEAWRDYALTVWAGFREHLDTEMGSASYQSKTVWPGILSLAEATGESDALWSDPRFLALVDRFFAQTAPLGVLPGYGDASGWAHAPTGLVWLFEEAARRTGEGRYRWLAHRVFAYESRHARHAPPKRDSWRRELFHLLQAYRSALAGDGETEAPAPLREAATAAQNGGAASWRLAGPVGQSFTHDGGTLVRVGLHATAPAEARPRIRIWPWRGAPAATRAAPPLYSAEAVRVGEQLSAFPVIPAGEPARYYVELEADGAALEVRGSSSDAYPAGRAFGLPGAASADLRFEIHSLRGYGSALTHRQESAWRPQREWGTPRRVHAFTGRRVPSKLVLRSGPDPADLFVLFNLLSGHRHGQANLGALSVVLDRASVVLGETSFPYGEHALRPEEENVALVRRYRGGEPEEPGRSVEVPRFVDTRNLSVAWLRFRDMEGWGVAQERRVYFVKNRLLWIRDGFDLPPDVHVSVGPVWHPSHVETPASPGDGHRIAYPHPLENEWPHHNPPRTARLWMPAIPGSEETLERMPEHVPAPECEAAAAGPGPLRNHCRYSPYYALSRRWTGESGGGRRVWLDTVLVPEAPEERSRLRVLPTQGGARALEVTVRGERWLLVDNPERRAVEAGGVATDALYAVVRGGPQPSYAHVAEATRFEGAGLRLASESPSTTERGAFDAGRGGGDD